MLLHRLVHPLGSVLLIPYIAPELRCRVDTLRLEQQPLPAQQLPHRPDAIRHSVVPRQHWQPTLAQFRDKGRSRRIHHHSTGRLSIQQRQQVIGILPISLLPHLPTAVPVIFPLAHPSVSSPQLPPQQEHRRISGAVVTADVAPTHTVRRLPEQMHLRPEHIVDQSLRRHPQSTDIAIIKNPRIGGFIPCPHRGRQGGIVRHSEVQIEQIFSFPLLDPLPIEPMFRPFRIAVEPVFRPLHTTARQRLLHKGTGHQHHLIKEHPSQGDTLNQGIAPFVFAAEQVVLILMSHPSHRDPVLASLLLELEHPLQPPRRLPDHIPPQRLDGLAAQRKSALLKGGHTPQEKPHRHR